MGPIRSLQYLIKKEDPMIRSTIYLLSCSLISTSVENIILFTHGSNLWNWSPPYFFPHTV